jgi:hypothetical protein
MIFDPSSDVSSHRIEPTRSPFFNISSDMLSKSTNLSSSPFVNLWPTVTPIAATTKYSIASSPRLSTSLGYDAPTAVNVAREVEPLSSASRFASAFASSSTSESAAASSSESASDSELTAKPTKTGSAGHVGVSFTALLLGFVIAAGLY